MNAVFGKFVKYFDVLKDIIFDSDKNRFISQSDSPEIILKNVPFGDIYFEGKLLSIDGSCLQPTVKTISKNKNEKYYPLFYNSDTQLFNGTVLISDEVNRISFIPVFQKAEFVLENIRIFPTSKWRSLLSYKSERNTKALLKVKFIFYLFFSFFRYIYRYGFWNSILRVVRFFKNQYTIWYTINDNDLFINRKKIEKEIASFSVKPKISVLMPVYNVEEIYLKQAITSIQKQLYSNWELCIADDNSTYAYIRPYLSSISQQDSRIKVVFRNENGHISKATNSALDIATGEYIALMDNDDLLRPHSLFEVAKAINQKPHVQLIYTDEDKISEKTRRFSPFFKPDWAPELFYSMNILTHLNVFKTEIAKEINGFRVGFEGSQDYDFCLRYIEKIDYKNIHHIPKILYHWRAIDGSVALDSRAKQYAHKAARKAIYEHLQRRNINAEVSSGYGPLHRVKYSIEQNKYFVSIIICTRDNPIVLNKAISSILELSTYNEYEIIVIDNGSKAQESLEFFNKISKNPRVKVIRYDCEFNYSYLNNQAVKHAKGNVLCLLNDDVEVVSGAWIEELLSYVQFDDVGAVGAKLHYPVKKIQHYGIITGIVGGVAGHQFRFFDSNAEGYFGRLKVPTEVSAVTGACLMVKRAHFDQVMGLDEVNLKVAYNDIDFCLKLLDLNLRNIVTPYAELIHYESLTRGPDTTPEKSIRLKKEQDFMVSKWGDKLIDRYYNLNLSNESESYEYSWPPRFS